ncbi:MAG: YdcH family protein [Acidobacteriota bacterium]
MPLTQDLLKERLERDNTEYRELADKHRDYERRLDRLYDRHFLTDAERIEAARLKKQKLALKDRMAEIARTFGVRAGSREGN